ncbi:MAG: phosphoribosylformylglycinamidine synthase subunit PurL [Deltaproteobacteria bacterium CG17_big_fil_post_rev_8_21_14_2_50_63_7]|nr:MAG: phosphoribosylformylglycinamidine synthase subunit PurL [Deltaproteobacteria bacterium CG17_big_fil_post_rev_8_21_14_2_50_63_7]
MKLAVLASGRGSNLQAILDASRAGTLDAQVTVVLSNRAEALALRRAEEAGVSALFEPLAPWLARNQTRRDYDAHLAQVLRGHGVELVVLAGWMHVFDPVFMDTVGAPVVNLHPALPGAFPGLHAIRRAHEACARGELVETGVMVHHVTAELDAGPVVRQAALPLVEGEPLSELEARCHALEHEVLLGALRELVSASDLIVRVDTLRDLPCDPHLLPLAGVRCVESSVFTWLLFEAKPEPEAVRAFAQRTLRDPVVERVCVGSLPTSHAFAASGACSPSSEAGLERVLVEVAPRPGVTDSESNSVLAEGRAAGLPLRAVSRGRRYVFEFGPLPPTPSPETGEGEERTRDGVGPLPPTLDPEPGQGESGLRTRASQNEPARPHIPYESPPSPVPGEEGGGGHPHAHRNPRFRRAVELLLCNPVVQRVSYGQPLPPSFVTVVESDGRCERFDVGAMDDAALDALSRARRLALNLDEMRAIRAEAVRLARTLTDVELEMLAQTWSEHCSHKTFEARIDFDDDGDRREVDGLLPCLRSATEELAPAWLRSAFVDNAGIVGFFEGYDLAFKVETHNHPSALDPFGGAHTGVGGVIRDILGVSARPMANLDVLCFGDPETPVDHASGILPPEVVMDGVVRGVADYGNKMGIPTVAGAVVFHPGYTANPLVYCGCLGILPTGAHPTTPQVDDLVVVIGGRTGRDGLRGATFSSMVMHSQSSEEAGSAVQLGDPICEKQVLEVVLAARDARLYHAITDCGAGGLSSAVGELAKKLGADVELAGLPVKYLGLVPWELWLSEAQERMVLAVCPSAFEDFARVCHTHAVEAHVLGRFTGEGRLVVRWRGVPTLDLSAEFLRGGPPRASLTARWSSPQLECAALPEGDLGALVLELARQPNSSSREAVVTQFDGEVQGATWGRSLVGEGQGPGDGAVLSPREVRAGDEGVAIGLGINPFYGELDPRAMAFACVDEAFRNLVAVGGDPDQVALLDNFCWGSPSDEATLGALVRCFEGCREAALLYGAPFVSGKDSLNNQYQGPSGERVAIPGTLLISAIAPVRDVRHGVTSAFAAAGNSIYLVGATRPELGGTAISRMLGLALGAPPQPLGEPLGVLRRLHVAVRQEQIEACHDLSDGGLALALLEMARGGGCGAVVDLGAMRVEGELGDFERLFSESLGRFLVEVGPAQRAQFEAGLGDDARLVGRVVSERTLRIRGANELVIAVGKPM